MASIDEAYLDMTGTERLHGPPLRAAHLLHERVKARHGAELLDGHLGLAAGGQDRLGPGQAQRRPVGHPGQEAAFLAPLDVRKVPGVGKVTEKHLHTLGIRKVGDLARLDDAFLERRFGKWGLALAGKSRGLDAGGWFDHEIGADAGPKSISHEHTFSEDTADRARLEATLAHLCEMVGRRLREHGLRAAHHPAQAALLGFLHHHARAFARARHRSSIPSCSRRFARCSGATGSAERRAPAGRARVVAGTEARRRWA